MSSDENTKEAIESNELPQGVKTKFIIKEQNNLNIYLKLKDFLSTIYNNNLFGRIIITIVFFPFFFVYEVFTRFIGLVWGNATFNQSIANNFAGILAFLHAIVYLALLAFVVTNALVQFDVLSFVDDEVIKQYMFPDLERYGPVDTGLGYLAVLLSYFIKGNTLLAIIQAFFAWMAYSIFFGLLSTFVSINENLSAIRASLEEEIE